MTLTAHPERDVLMMFGGEYFDGSRVCFKSHNIVLDCYCKYHIMPEPKYL